MHTKFVGVRKMAKYINYSLALGVLSFVCMASDSYSQTCQTVYGSCNSLGYNKTESQCPGDKLRCPWDTSKVACFSSGSSSVYDLPVLFSNGEISYSNIGSASPIGIVFDKQRRLALALTTVKKDGSPSDLVNGFCRTASPCQVSETKMYWSSNNKSNGDVAEILNCSVSSEASGDNGQILDYRSCGIDGEYNTNASLSNSSYSSSVGTLYALKAARAYQPSVCSVSFCKKGKWFLPSLEDLIIIGNLKGAIASTMTQLGLNYYLPSALWSSSECTNKGLEYPYGIGLFSQSSFAVDDDEFFNDIYCISQNSESNQASVLPVVKY